VLSFVPSLAWADESAPATWAEQRVQDGLVRPLSDQGSKRFSRARPVPRERRVRITGTAPIRDAKGREFMTFAVDVRFGRGEWKQDDIVGCVYRGSGALFVEREGVYYPASLLLGKDAAAVSGVCRPAPTTRS